MKKKSVALLLCTMSVVLSSCGQAANTNTGVKNSETVQEIVPETEAVAKTENETETDDRKDGAFFGVKIEENSDSYTADDGTEIFVGTCSYPELTGGNTEAAEKINTDIQAMKEEREARVAEIVGYAKDDYQYRIEENEGVDTEMMGFYSYSEEDTSSVGRNDERVFSFILNSYEYTGGAHGYGFYAGYNYDASTGERLSLTDLSEDGNAWKENILSYVEEKCKTEEYQELLFEEYETCLTDAVFAEDNWFFTEDGLTITCSPYAIGPYASGSINFEIPYETLQEFGLKDCYLKK